MRIISIAMLFVALLMLSTAAAFATPAALPDDAGIPAFHDVVQAEFQPGVSTAKVVLESSYTGTFKMSYAPELRGNRMYVPLAAVCEVLDVPVNFDYSKNELVLPCSPEIRVPVSRDDMEKEACGEDTCIMLPLRKTFEKQGWKVDWQGGKAVIYRR